MTLATRRAAFPILDRRPPREGWSWDNQGSATETTLDNGGLVYAVPTNAGDLTVRHRAHSSGDIHTAEIDGLTNIDHSGIGLAFRSAADTGKMTVIYAKPYTGTVGVEDWTSSVEFTTVLVSINIPEQTRWWFQVEDNATNLIFRLSTSGAPGSFKDVHSVGRTAFMASGPDQVGIVLRAEDNLRATVFSFATT